MIPSTVLFSPLSLHPPPTIPNPNSNPSSPPPLLRSRRCHCRCRRTGASWDPNAESVPRGRFKFEDSDGAEDKHRAHKRKWWSDGPSDDLKQEFDPFGGDDDDDDDEFQQPWDRIWIFKVFRSYGYLLPAIITSMLLATGPKAFLMALALPLGQSVFSLVIDKVWGKPFSTSSADSRKHGRGERSKSRSRSDDYKGKSDYQSWVSAEVGNEAFEGGGPRGSTFGGWDELVSQRGPTRKQATSVGEITRSEPVKKGKLSRRGRYRDVPLFFRLMVAVFPFLGSWMKIL